MLLLLALACKDPVPEPAEPVDLLESVNVFVGTGGAGFGHAALSPAACVPNGLAKPGPDTSLGDTRVRVGANGGYDYVDTHIVGFSHTRLPGIGVADGGAVAFMPAAVEVLDWKQRKQPFSHDAEAASPGWYGVTLDGLAEVSLSATERAAHHRYDWLGEGRWLTVDLGHTVGPGADIEGSWLELEGQELRGYAFLRGALTGRQGRGTPVYFVARFSEPIEEAGAWVDEARVGELAADRLEGNHVAATLRFPAASERLEVRVGLSVVDIDGARANLDAELPEEQTLEQTHAAARQAWRDALEVFEVTGGTTEQQRIFASALYHARMMPTLFTDTDGRFRALDGGVGEADGWTYYTDFSMWDTYRTLHPLVTLAWPALSADFARSLTDMGERTGYLPRWPAGAVEAGSMVGTPADIVLADAWLKGVRDFDAETAFDLALARATDPDSPYARAGLRDYQDLGYLPYDRHGAATAQTLEFAVADFALARWAEDMGRDPTALDEQALAYTEVFDPETAFMRGRMADGTWAELEDEGWGEAYAEGNAWQYTWMVTQDADGLAALFGGPDAALDKLQELFERSEAEEDTFLPDPYYWHGNEPDLGYAFMFADLGRPADTQRWARWIMGRHYADDPAGLDGNDDGGTLSAWTVFAAMGVYPAVGTDRYLLTTPVFDTLTLTRPDGVLSVQATGVGDYIAGVSLDAGAQAEAELRHQDLVGASLVFERSETPTDWGAW